MKNVFYAKASLLAKLPESSNFIKKEILVKVFFTEHLRVTASDILIQVVLIYHLNLYLQFVTINSTFFLLQNLALAHVSMSLVFLHRFVSC